MYEQIVEQEITERADDIIEQQKYEELEKLRGDSNGGQS